METVREDSLDHLADLALRLTRSEDKLALLKETEEYRCFLKARPYVLSLQNLLDRQEQLVLCSVAAIGQAMRLFPQDPPASDECGSIQRFIQSLLPVEDFYSSIGGIVGYHASILSLLSTQGPKADDEVHYKRPSGADISASTPLIRSYIKEGIEKTAKIAEIYPVGGAGDRLSLLDKKSGEPLPAACLVFMGHTLLERLIRDLEAREYLAYKLTGERITTPVAMMTSFEKNNHQLIVENLTRKGWFGRPQSSFYLFIQPQVPVLDTKGNWLLKAPWELIMKPGGHGALWTKAARDGILQALKSKGISKLLVKQINNPIAGTDGGILAFLGMGLKESKMFGFASCERVVHAHEGMDVVLERREGESFSYCLTNVEYTEFKRKGIEDAPKEVGSIYSLFPCNTNILFADIEEIERAENICPIPGITLNMKSSFMAIDPEGLRHEVKGGRLESTMQNIADVIVETFPNPLRNGEEVEKLRSYLTYNDRRKTLSVTKKAWDGSGSCLETPEGCFYDMMLNAEDLLKNHCNFKVPRQPDISEFMKRGPSFVFAYLPALGPLYEVIGQKIRSGVLSEGSEFVLEVAEVEIDGLELTGSLEIMADWPIGASDEKGAVQLGMQEPYCILKNVTVVNKGIGGPVRTDYWQGCSRKEVCSIKLEEGAAFIAEDVTIEGSFSITVPKGMSARAFMEGGELKVSLQKNERSTIWKYTFDLGDRVVLSHDAEDNS
ncbi:Conserved hypothetical protein [Estrella lausannensis]|uniref:UGP3-like C-terminal hexapeptide repeats domain-containing protein n=2 Tax=Estrella lausannensis TaxID=483423 RepID=A0A0H5DQK1_9BACT|nr:Conserved hypothetical protein [Estrella lausannensis]